MLILEGIPIETDNSRKLKADQYEPLVEHIMKREQLPEDLFLIFVSYKPDKRVRFYKRLIKEANIKEFGMHDKRGLKKFIKEIAPDLALPEEGLAYLIEKVGNDQFRLHSEIEKLRYFKQIHPENPISLSIIDEVVFGQTEANGFLFFDMLLEDRVEALKLLEKLQKEGSDWNQVN